VGHAPTLDRLRGSAYHVTRLNDPFGFEGKYGSASINASGQIVGTYSDSTARTSVGVIWDRSLTPVPLPTPRDGWVTNPSGINDAGQVTGTTSPTNSSGVPTVGFIWSAAGGLREVLDVRPFGASLYSINSAGIVAGQRAGQGVSGTEGNVVPFALGGRVFASVFAVNDRGDAIGYLDDTLDFGFVRNGSLKEFPEFGFPFVHKVALNNVGEFVFTGQNDTFMGVYRDGTFRTLSTGGALGRAINDAGVIAGERSVGGTGRRATLWEGDVPVDLNTLLIDPPAGLVLERALDINNDGVIVASGFIAGGGNGRFGFLLTPVPEPMATAVLCLPLFRRGRRRHADA
jgi:hypothetical protein